MFTAATQAGVTRIVYSSSIAAYGVVPGHPEPITEDATRVHQPGFAYAATKFEVEAWLDRFEVEGSPERIGPVEPLSEALDHQIAAAASNMPSQRFESRMLFASGHVDQTPLSYDVVEFTQPLRQAREFTFDEQELSVSRLRSTAAARRLNHLHRRVDASAGATSLLRKTNECLAITAADIQHA